MLGSIQNLRRAAAGVAVFLAAYTAIVTWYAWSDARDNHIAMLTTVTELEARAVDGYLGHLESDLRGLGEDLLQDGDRVDLKRAHRLVVRFRHHHAELHNVTLIEPDGNVLMTAKNAPGTFQASLASEPSFRAFLDEISQGQALVIGQPLIGVVSQTVIVPVRLALRDAQGRLSYVVSANLNHEHLQALWVDAPITAKAAIGLMRDNGYLLSRFPVPAKLSLEQIYGQPRTGALVNHLRRNSFPAKGHVQGPSSLDGPEYLSAFRRLSNYPVTLFVAMPMAEIHRAWLERVAATYTAIAFLLLGGYGSYRYALRRQKSWDREQQLLQQAQQRNEELVRQLAFHDPLTGLPNRRLLSDRLNQALLASKRNCKYLALLFLDLDNFKPLNDRHGHEVGDLLLIEVANRLRCCVREIDTVARFGGDEFVVVLSELSADQEQSRSQALAVAEKIRAALACPYELTALHEGQPDRSLVHHGSASIGVVLVLDEAEQTEVVKGADAAMYLAKQAGGNAVRFSAID